MRKRERRVRNREKQREERMQITLKREGEREKGE